MAADRVSVLSPPHLVGRTLGSDISCTRSLLFLYPLLLCLHPPPPPPPPARCQTDPPCSLRPYWRMEKQSSRNSPDNCPPVIFSSPLSLLLFCPFIYSFPPQSVSVPCSFLKTPSDSAAFYGEPRKRQFLSPSEGRETEASLWSALVFAEM